MNLVSANQNRLDSNTLKFLECPLSHGSMIIDRSFSLNDNIFSPDSAVSTYVIPNDSSDHCILMADFSLYFRRIKKVNKGKRLWGKFFLKLKEELDDVEWSSVIDEMNPNQS